jgi:PIN domain nuclease of toxin-antitoxin system
LQPNLLLDTHVLVRWLIEPRRLSRDQIRTLKAAVRRTEPVAFSALSLLEIAVLHSSGRLGVTFRLDAFFDVLQSNPAFRVLPVTYEIASETAALAGLRDPVDRAIVATARVHRLRLVTSDQRILESKLVAVIP